MKVYVFKNKETSNFCGVILSDKTIKAIKAQKTKDIHKTITHSICSKPKKDFKKFIKNIKQNNFFKNSTSLQSLEDLEQDLIIKSYDKYSIERTIIFLYELSLTSEQLDDSTISMLIGDIPF
jgi:hypothetical protein